MLGLLVFSLTVLGSYSDPLYRENLSRESLNKVYSFFNHQPQPISPSTLALSGEASSEEAFVSMTIFLSETGSMVQIELVGPGWWSMVWCRI